MANEVMDIFFDSFGAGFAQGQTYVNQQKEKDQRKVLAQQRSADVEQRRGVAAAEKQQKKKNEAAKLDLANSILMDSKTDAIMRLMNPSGINIKVTNSGKDNPNAGWLNKVATYNNKTKQYTVNASKAANYLNTSRSLWALGDRGINNYINNMASKYGFNADIFYTSNGKGERVLDKNALNKLFNLSSASITYDDFQQNYKKHAYNAIKAYNALKPTVGGDIIMGLVPGWGLSAVTLKHVLHGLDRALGASTRSTVFVGDKQKAGIRYSNMTSPRALKDVAITTKRDLGRALQQFPKEDWGALLNFVRNNFGVTDLRNTLADIENEEKLRRQGATEAQIQDMKKERLKYGGRSGDAAKLMQYLNDQIGMPLDRQRITIQDVQRAVEGINSEDSPMGKDAVRFELPHIAVPSEYASKQGARIMSLFGDKDGKIKIPAYDFFTEDGKNIQAKKIDDIEDLVGISVQTIVPLPNGEIYYKILGNRGDSKKAEPVTFWTQMPSGLDNIAKENLAVLAQNYYATNDVYRYIKRGYKQNMSPQRMFESSNPNVKAFAEKYEPLIKEFGDSYKGVEAALNSLLDNWTEDAISIYENALHPFAPVELEKFKVDVFNSDNWQEAQRRAQMIQNQEQGLLDDTKEEDYSTAEDESYGMDALDAYIASLDFSSGLDNPYTDVYYSQET